MVRRRPWLRARARVPRCAARGWPVDAARLACRRALPVFSMRRCRPPSIEYVTLASRSLFFQHLLGFRSRCLEIRPTPVGRQSSVARSVPRSSGYRRPGIEAGPSLGLELARSRRIRLVDVLDGGRVQSQRSGDGRRGRLDPLQGNRFIHADPRPTPTCELAIIPECATPIAVPSCVRIARPLPGCSGETQSTPGRRGCRTCSFAHVRRRYMVAKPIA